MKATLLLADSGQADPAGKAHVLGAGWSVTVTPTPPMALVILIDVPWDQTNTKHRLNIDLVDGDGRQVTTEGPMGSVPALQIEAEFEAGRPPGLPPGTPIRQTLALNIGPGMNLKTGEKYEFRMSIDGRHVDGWLATFFVRA